MPLQLDHTIVPAYDKVKSVKLIARIFRLEYNGTWGHFALVKANNILTLDFDDSDDPRSNHYAFLASDEDFDAVRVLGRMARSITRTGVGGFILSVRMGMFGRLLRTLM